MSLSPLLSAPPAIQIHAVAAILAFVLGPFVIFRARRDGLHRKLGYAWVALMTITAFSAIFINEIKMLGPFSPIHLFVPLTIGGLAYAIRQIRAGRISAHRKSMTRLYFFALIGAGLFTFLPGRIMSRMAFADVPMVPWIGFATLCCLAALSTWRNRDRIFE